MSAHQDRSSTFYLSNEVSGCGQKAVMRCPIVICEITVICGWIRLRIGRSTIDAHGDRVDPQISPMTQILGEAIVLVAANGRAAMPTKKPTAENRPWAFVLTMTTSASRLR
jgi:hypothetical protein